MKGGGASMKGNIALLIKNNAYMTVDTSSMIENTACMTVYTAPMMKNTVERGWTHPLFLSLLFFACPKKSNKRKGTTMTNHKLLLVAQATATQPQNLWFALIVDTRPQATNASWHYCLLILENKKARVLSRAFWDAEPSSAWRQISFSFLVCGIWCRWWGGMLSWNQGDLWYNLCRLLLYPTCLLRVCRGRCRG